jgi:hypothetical protein
MEESRPRRYKGRYNEYKDHYACFECRKAFRISPFREWLPPEVHFGAVIPEVKCPDCKRPMVSMGRNFKAPKRTDIKQWRLIQLLNEAGFFYPPRKCVFGNPPVSPNQVPAFLERCRQNASKGSRLAARYLKVRKRKKQPGDEG